MNRCPFCQTPIPSDNPTRCQACSKSLIDLREEVAAAMMGRYLAGETTADDVADLLVPLPAVDLRAVPVEQWREHLLGEVRLPADVRAFVEGQIEFTREELDRLEDRIAAYYGVQEPWHITCEAKPVFSAWLGKDS